MAVAEKIGHDKRTDESVLVHALLSCVNYDRNRRSYSLVSALGNNAHGKLASAHSGVGTRGGIRSRLVLDGNITVSENELSYRRAVFVSDTFLCNRHIHIYLAFNAGAQIGQIHSFGKFDNIFNVQKRSVRCVFSA